jgi:hypothetical protein
VKNNILTKLLIASALLICAVPVTASAQIYNRYPYDRNEDRYRYDRNDRNELRTALVRLDDTSARLESNLSMTRGRRVLGLFWVTENNNSALGQISDFRRALRQLRRASAGGRDLQNSYDEARMVVDLGFRLDRNLRLRTGRTDVDQELAELRSNLHVIAETYDIRLRY